MSPGTGASVPGGGGNDVGAILENFYIGAPGLEPGGLLLGISGLPGGGP